MSSKYDETVQISREEEGSFHRREYETTPASKPTTTYTQSYQVVSPSKSYHDTSDSDGDKYEEWTVSKRKVNHKTRQVETRVSRQLLVEDGKVIADSGPQVTTRIKEDNKVEECEKEKTPKNKSKFEAIENAPEGESTGRVLGEKKEIQRVSREVREENMQYHDERFKELTGHDVHRRAIQAPHELITITDKNSHAAPRGKMVHYSNKGKKYQDTDEILEVAKLAIDGSITKEVKRTKHHEEFSEDEKPDETGEAEALRKAPTVTRSSRKHVDYVNDFDDIDSSPTDVKHHGRQHSSSSSKHHGRSRDTKQHKSKEDEAFPRYEIDPLLNSLKDEDFIKPMNGERGRSGRYREHALERKEVSDSSSDDDGSRHHYVQQRQRSPSPYHSSLRGGGAVEIPEEYRVNKQRLLSGKGGQKSTSSHQRERSFSPANKSHLSHRSSKSHRSQKEDASVQAHLTDEEEERKSIRSSSSGVVDSHGKATRQLQRQSTVNSQRNYYFGESRRRSPSVRSSSSSNLSDPKERMRKSGARSKDSGFKSPQSMRTATPISTGSQQHIYSVSSKAKKNRDRENRGGAASPTPTGGSLGQRSVKTTTTTMSANLADRPLSRSERSSGSTPTTNKSSKDSKQKRVVESGNGAKDARGSFDSISLSSLGPNATTIKVPYKQVIEHNDSFSANTTKNRSRVDRQIELENGEMKPLHEDIENLRKRLDNIKRHATITRDGTGPEPEHFDYKTIIANVQPAPLVPRQHVVNAYNVRVIEHKSPFVDNQQPIKSVNELSNSIARLELQSSELGSSIRSSNDDTSTANNYNNNDNNNISNFNLDDFVKHKAMPVMVCSTEDDMEDDRASLVSSCSLRSSRTYDIRAPGTQDHRLNDGDELNEEKHFPVEVLNFGEFGDDAKKPSAWIFDLRDGSSTAIAAPPRPKRSESPRIDSKTEELAQSKGGRSYYLELVESGITKEKDEEVRKEKQRQRPSSIDSLYTRWNSHSALSGNNNRCNQPPQRQSTPTKSPILLTSQDTRSSRQMVPASVLDSNNRPIVSSSLKNTNIAQTNGNFQRRQLPFSGPPLSNRSKSSSCLLGSTRPTKYSIYGGLRRTNGNNKPVPRLSYSRAIGPKSQRQIDAQPKTPSRYLKMR